MRLWLTGFGLSLLCFPAAADEFRFKYANSEVDFVSWAPQAAEFDYQSLAPPAERRKELEASGALFAERLLRFESRLTAHGTIETRATSIRYFVSKAGAQQYGNLSEWVDSAFEKLSIEQAYTLTPDGRVLPVEPTAVQVRPDSQDDIFDDTFEIVLPFPGIEAGSMAVIVSNTVEDVNALPIPWSHSSRARWFVPIEEFEMTFSWDEGVEAPIWKTDDDGIECVEGDRVIRCRAHDVPALPSDRNVVYLDVSPSVVIAPSASWQSLAAHVAGYIAPKVDRDDVDIREFVATLRSKTGNQTEILQELHRFVSQDIRYVGLEKGTGGIIPRDPGLTLMQRFGDCKDKATLFLAMAREAGIAAYPVLVALRRTDPKRLLLPALGYFDHMIVCARTENGNELCTDLTDPFSALDSLSSSTQGSVALFLKEDAAVLSSLPVDTYLDKISVHEQNTFDQRGNLDVVGRYSYTGQYAAWIRAKLQALTLSEQSNWLLDWYKNTVSDRGSPEMSVDGTHDVGKPLVITYRSSFDRLVDPSAIETGGTEYSDYDAILRSVRRDYELANKHFRSRFYGLDYESHIEFTLPPDYTTDLHGARLDLKSEYGELQRDYTRGRSTVGITTTARFPARAFAPDDQSKFNRWLGYAEDSAKYWFNIRRPD